MMYKTIKVQIDQTFFNFASQICDYIKTFVQITTTKYKIQIGIPTTSLQL